MPATARKASGADAGATGVIGPVERELLALDGTRVSALITGACIEDPNDGQVIWATVQDLGQRRARERELVVLRTGFLCRSGYEWTQHVPIGQRAGLTDAEIAAIKLGADGPNWSAADRALLRATDELHAGQFITDATWQALAAHFQPRQCMDVVFTVGQYTQVSMILNSFGVQLDEGQVLDPDLRG